jgi:hypothetical protein
LQDQQDGRPVTGDLKGKYDPNLIHAFNLNFIPLSGLNPAKKGEKL